MIAEAAGEIIGMCSLQNNEYVDIMFVHQNFQRQGIANQLLESILKQAEILGTKHVYTDSSITAKLFFERKGFKAVRANQNIVGNQVLINYKMVKEL